MAVDIWDLGLVVLDMALGIKSGRGHRDKYPCPELVPGRLGAGAGAGAGARDGASASAADMLDVVPPVPAFLSADATKFVVSCLIPKASVRPSAEELLSMPFVQVMRCMQTPSTVVQGRVLAHNPGGDLAGCACRRLRPPQPSRMVPLCYCAAAPAWAPRVLYGETIAASHVLWLPWW